MLQVGELLYGFCSGYFGSSSYSTKRVEGVGADWVLARDEQGEICLATDDCGMGAEKFHTMLREVSSERQCCEVDEGR